MSDQYSNSWKVCATCSFWCGPRDVDSFGQYVTVESAMTQGKCMGNCGWRNSMRQANGSSCNAFQKWAVLR